ncbi:hypothetical protein VO63_10910 [Streptomyces showdoensis]|uniref:Uncharacterized protein n=1 Tax=Streptomyces showdoensis TaxID=68268 RepID=A0A2P2GQS1_STREW|nr:hypothetical protein VO63_10910 [Streptomyces showdoensis]
MGEGVLLASRWEAGEDIVRLAVGLFRVAFGALPDWIRYPVVGLGCAVVLYCVATRCRDWWRERRNAPAETASREMAETTPDT